MNKSKGRSLTGKSIEVSSAGTPLVSLQIIAAQGSEVFKRKDIMPSSVRSIGRGVDDDPATTLLVTARALTPCVREDGTGPRFDRSNHHPDKKKSTSSRTAEGAQFMSSQIPW
jgi:hypothetical protein